MRRLPKGATIALAARSQPSAGGGIKLDRAESFLLSHRSELVPFQGPEDFATASVNERGPSHDALEHHLIAIRAAIARELWSREFFVGISVLDDLLFYAAQSGQRGLIAHVIDRLRAKRAHSAGMVVFPVHSFGFRQVGFALSLRGAKLSLQIPEAGLVVVPQTNDLSSTYRILEEARQGFRIKPRLPANLLAHWERKYRRDLRWLSTNPLVVMKVHSLPGTPFENEKLLVHKLQANIGAMSLLAGLQRVNQDSAGMSTAHVNNFETLDLNHYIVFYAPWHGQELNGDCVPNLSRSRAALPELSELPVHLDTRFWKRRANRMRAVFKAVERVSEGILSGMRSGAEREWMQRVLKKLFEGLTYFRRSLRPSDKDWQSIIALATAYEYVLTDSYSQGVGATLKTRASALLKGVRDKGRLIQSISDVYDARSEIVHGGLKPTRTNLVDARDAFARIFLALSERLPLLKHKVDAPIGWLCDQKI